MDRPIDIALVNGTVLTMTDEGRVFDQGVVLVEGDRIAAAGPADLLKNRRVLRTLDAKGGIIMPGLINTHTHAAMTCFRGLADDLPLMTWLNDHIFPAEAGLTSEKVYSGALLGCAEMMLSGTTCFCDMYLFADSVARAAHDAGMRAVVGEVLFDFPSPSYGPLEAGFACTEALIEKWRDHPLVRVAVEPHSPYLCSPELLKRAFSISREKQTLLVTHLSETQAETADIRRRYGKTPVGHLADIGVLNPDLLAAHCVVLTPEDITLLKRFDVKVSHNPESNMKLASGVAPVPELLERGITVGLGTDGCSSNNDQDMFSEMNTAAKLHKVYTLDPSVLSARTVLRMATIHAAGAIGMADRIGTIEPGKQADLIIIDTRKPHLTPLYNPFSHLVYAVSGSDVRDVLIAGRVVVKDRELQTIDGERIMAKVRGISRETAGRYAAVV